MITLLNKLFEPAPDPPSEDETTPTPGLKDCDAFGTELIKYQNAFTSAEMDALLPHLFELGRSTHPIKDWHRFKQSVRWPQHDQNLRYILDDWWNLLHRLVAQMRHESRNGRSIRPDSCPLQRHHLPLARSVVWLQIHHQGRRLMPQLLKFLSDCLVKYPNCPEVTQQLAQSAANMLVREDYYQQWKPRIAFQYPELMKGRIGGRLVRA